MAHLGPGGTSGPGSCLQAVSGSGVGTPQGVSGAGAGTLQPSFCTINPPAAAGQWGPGTAGPPKGTSAGRAVKVADCI